MIKYTVFLGASTKYKVVAAETAESGGDCILRTFDVAQGVFWYSIRLVVFNGYDHVHTVWYIVLDVLSHDIIIGLIDLIGPYYNLFEDSITSSRHIATANQLGDHLDTIIPKALTTSMTTHTPPIVRNALSLDQQQQVYCNRKKLICASFNTNIDLLALQDGSSAEILSHPLHGSVYSDNRIESRYQLL